MRLREGKLLLLLLLLLLLVVLVVVTSKSRAHIARGRQAQTSQTS